MTRQFCPPSKNDFLIDVTREADGCDDPYNNTCHKKRKEMHLM
jgi:hypothetical protein